MRDLIVSVIIPTYNRAQCLGDAIGSVLAQSFHDYELIVVDDGSIDSTEEVVKSYGERVKLIRQENGGASAARNTGIRAAKGEWIAFLDSDDTWEPDKLKVQVNDLQAKPGAVAHMVDADIFVSDHEHVSHFELRGMHDDFLRNPVRERPLCDVLKTHFNTPTWMLHRKAVESAGYFDTRLRIFEDIDFLTRVAMEGPFVINCYSGTNVRRLSGSYPLSDLYKEQKLQFLANVLHTYNHLKMDPRLTAQEHQCVRRLIGGAQCEIATQHRKQRNYNSAFHALLRSVAEEPGLRSVARAILNAVAGQEFIDRLAHLRKKSVSRRSEQNRAAGRIGR